MSIRSTITIEQPAAGSRAGATTAQVAQRFVVSPETVRRWARSGRVPAFRAGFLLRFDLQEVEAFVRANRRLSSHVERQKRRAALRSA